MRATLVLLHRWFGLTAALFLFIAGLTGAVISWDHELDAWLNPQFYYTSDKYSSSNSAVLPAVELAARIEAADPRLRVTYLPLANEVGHTVQASVEPRVNKASGKLFDVDYNQVAIDPMTGVVQAKRYWGAVSLSRENLLPFLYKLHYSMHIPQGGGIEWGIWLMGLIGVVWIFDCFIALYLSFPTLSSWGSSSGSSWRKSLGKSFIFRFKRGGYALNFDLHRSGGVWLWLLLLMLAITSVSMNLNTEVMRPIVSRFSTLSPSPFASRQPIAAERAVEPRVSAQQIIATAQREAISRAWQRPIGALYYSAIYDLYGVGFFAPGEEHGDGGLGNPWLYFDAQDARLVGADVPGEGTAGDIFLQAQFPLHSGRLIGLPGRVLISLLGLAVAILSATGVVIWAKKRRARRVQSRRAVAAPLVAG